MQDTEFETKRTDILTKLAGDASCATTAQDLERLAREGAKRLDDLDQERVIWKVLHKGDGDVGIEVSGHWADDVPGAATYLVIGRTLLKLGAMLLENASSADEDDEDDDF